MGKDPFQDEHESSSEDDGDDESSSGEDDSSSGEDDDDSSSEGSSSSGEDDDDDDGSGSEYEDDDDDDNEDDDKRKPPTTPDQDRSDTAKRDKRPGSGRFSGAAMGLFGKRQKEHQDDDDDENDKKGRDAFHDEGDDDDDDEDDSRRRGNWDDDDDDDPEVPKKARDDTKNKRGSVTKESADYARGKWIVLAVAAILLVIGIVVVVAVVVAMKDSDDKEKESSPSPSVSAAPSLSAVPTISPAPSVSLQPSGIPTLSNAPSISAEPSLSDHPSASPTMSSAPTSEGGGIPTFPAPPTTPAPTISAAPTQSPVTNTPTATPVRPDFVVTAELFDLVVATSADNGAAVRTIGSPQQQAYVWLESDVQAARNRRLRQEEQEQQEREQEHRTTGHTNPSLATRDLLADLHPFRRLQRYSLMTLFYATNGPTEWNNKASFGDTDESECLWGFNNILVDCETQTFDWEETNPDGTTNVTSIQEEVLIKLELANNRVTGNLVAEVAQLTSLRILVIDNTANSDAGLTGGIPAEWSALINLERVKIIANQFTEPLPADLTRNWSQLQRLNLARNQLPGPLPTSLTGSNHPNLEHIIVTGNQLTGLLTGIATITTLTQLVLNDNLFEGELPPELGNLQLLKSLRLGGNRFSGNFPSFVSTLTELKADCDLSRNQFSGVIPNNAFADLTQLQQLFLHDSGFGGPLPTSLDQLTKMRRLNVASQRTTPDPPGPFRGDVPPPLCTSVSETANNAYVYVFCENPDDDPADDTTCDRTVSVCCACCTCLPPPDNPDIGPT